MVFIPHSYNLWPSYRYGLLFIDILNIFAINIWFKKIIKDNDFKKFKVSVKVMVKVTVKVTVTVMVMDANDNG
jgi:hypothetical protein